MLGLRRFIQNDFEKQFDGARIIVSGKNNNDYIAGQKGYIVHLQNYTAKCRILLGHQYTTFQLNTNQFFLEYPEDYPTLPHPIVKHTKKGGGFIMGKMPRIFRWFGWAAVVYMIWDLATHLNTIVSFLAHVLILHK